MSKRFTEAEIAEVWERRKAGEPTRSIARRLGRNGSSIRRVFEDVGGVRPAPDVEQSGICRPGTGEDLAWGGCGGFVAGDAHGVWDGGQRRPPAGCCFQRTAPTRTHPVPGGADTRFMGNLDRCSHRLYSVRSGLLLITVVVLAAACGADAGISDVTDSSTTIVIGQLGFIEGTVTAGPQCPVQRVPPDPACQDRPVAGATILITERGSGTVARLVTDELGRFSAALAPVSM